MGGGKRCYGEEVDVNLPDIPKERFIKLVSNSVTVHLNNLNHTHVGDIADMYLESPF